MRSMTNVRGEEGVALLMAVVAILLLSVVVLDTRAGVDLFERLAYSSAQEIQTDYLARSGLALIQAALEDDAMEVDSFNDDWAAANEIGAVPVGDLGWVTAVVEDEDGKLDVNRLVDANGEIDGVAAARMWTLLVSLGLEDDRADEIVSSLIDWIDEDGIVEPGGAEDPHYTSLSKPYPVSNSRIRTIGEIALIKGIGPILLNHGEQDIPPLRRFITVYGDPSGLVNINTASVEVLMSLTPDNVDGVNYFIDRDLAEEVLQIRQETPFESKTELKERVMDFHEDLFNQISPLIDVKSSHFSARVLGETENSSSRASGVFRREADGQVHLVYYRGF
ncbi:general secretion pathway protein GspK [bacterium]|nr:MAG: general secretion pathway protein GspK [bacterium]